MASDQESLEIALIENIQREDLNPLEIAVNYKRLMDECGINQEQLGIRLGKSRSTITNFVRLLRLPPDIQHSVKEGLLSFGHAKVLSGVEELPRQMIAFKEALQKNLSVRQLENFLKTLPAKPSAKAQKTSDKPAALRKWEDELTSKFSSRVIIQRTAKGSGQIQITFLNDEELERLIEDLGV
jgi:ParB family chromosome partitioning protein